MGDALAANPFVLVTMPAAVALVLVVGTALVRHRALPDLTRVAQAPAMRAVVVVWLAFALCRLLAVVSGHASV